uniref:Heat shock cognate protein 80-like n=1 Tax=Rhizophora mucronata TaxID=61149 RepID=A0A2P2M1A4_RHIMU
MLTSAPACNASMNSLVPDLAIVPKLFTNSAFVMPIPLSMMDKVLLALSGTSLINNSG